MITDKRSEKVGQVLKNPAAEICWWFPMTKDQYRFEGNIKFVDTGPQRQDMWNNLQPAARQQFLWDNPPGKLWEKEEPNKFEGYEAFRRDRTGGEDGEPAPKIEIPPVPDNFLLMVLEPTVVKYLSLKTDYAQLDTKKESGEWTEQRINP